MNKLFLGLILFSGMPLMQCPRKKKTKNTAESPQSTTALAPVVTQPIADEEERFETVEWPAVRRHLVDDELCWLYGRLPSLIKLLLTSGNAKKDEKCLDMEEQYLAIIRKKLTLVKPTRADYVQLLPCLVSVHMLLKLVPLHPELEDLGRYASLCEGVRLSIACTVRMAHKEGSPPIIGQIIISCADTPTPYIHLNGRMHLLVGDIREDSHGTEGPFYSDWVQPFSPNVIKEFPEPDQEWLSKGHVAQVYRGQRIFPQGSIIFKQIRPCERMYVQPPAGGEWTLNDVIFADTNPHKQLADITLCFPATTLVGCAIPGFALSFQATLTVVPQGITNFFQIEHLEQMVENDTRILRPDGQKITSDPTPYDALVRWYTQTYYTSRSAEEFICNSRDRAQVECRHLVVLPGLFFGSFQKESLEDHYLLLGLLDELESTSEALGPEASHRLLIEVMLLAEDADLNLIAIQKHEEIPSDPSHSTTCASGIEEIRALNSAHLAWVEEQRNRRQVKDNHPKSSIVKSKASKPAAPIQVDQQSHVEGTMALERCRQAIKQRICGLLKKHNITSQKDAFIKPTIQQRIAQQLFREVFESGQVFTRGSHVTAHNPGSGLAATYIMPHGRDLPSLPLSRFLNQLSDSVRVLGSR